MSDDLPDVVTDESAVSRALDATPAAPRRRSSRLWWLVVLGVLVVIGTATAVLLSRTAREQADDPGHALEELAHAAEDGDWAGVDVYMDVDSVGLTFAQATVARAQRGDRPVGGSSSGGMSGHGSGFPASSMASGFAATFREKLRARVESGTAFADESLVGLLLAGTHPAVDRTSDTEAALTMTVAPAGREAEDITLKLSRVDGTWVLVEIDGSTDLYALFDL